MVVVILLSPASTPMALAPVVLVLLALSSSKEPLVLIPMSARSAMVAAPSSQPVPTLSGHVFADLAQLASLALAKLVALTLMSVSLPMVAVTFAPIVSILTAAVSVALAHQAFLALAPLCVLTSMSARSTMVAAQLWSLAQTPLDLVSADLVLVASLEATVSARILMSA